jgi:hypothetical protein
MFGSVTFMAISSFKQSWLEKFLSKDNIIRYSLAWSVVSILTYSSGQKSCPDMSGGCYMCFLVVR